MTDEETDHDIDDTDDRPWFSAEPSLRLEFWAEYPKVKFDCPENPGTERYGYLQYENWVLGVILVDPVVGQEFITVIHLDAGQYQRI